VQNNEFEKKDLWAEIKEDAETYLKNRRKPIINDVKRGMALPRGTEAMFRDALEHSRDEVIFLLNKFVYKNRKRSSQNRLSRMRDEELVNFAKQKGFVV